MPTLRTERLRLRDFTSSDVSGVHRYASDPEVCRYMDWGPNTLAQTETFVREEVAAAAASARDSFPWVITLDSVVIGACSVTVTSHAHRRGEMGYVLAQEHWGHGYASEAAAAVLDFARDELGLERVEATCRRGNLASQRVLRKIGMQREGVLRSHVVIRGRREDSLLFARVGRVVPG